MDKRKYLTKTLIAEFQELSNIEDCKFSENVYRLNDGRLIMEYNGGRLSIYGLTLGFNKHIPRKGICNLDKENYDIWKSIRSKQENGFFVDWEKMQEEQFQTDHETVLKCIGSDELPF